MGKKIERCLFAMSERERTTTVMITRMGEIKNAMRRAAGALKSMTAERIQRNPPYWSVTAAGWGEKLRLLSNELVLIQAALAKELNNQ